MSKILVPLLCPLFAAACIVAPEPDGADASDGSTTLDANGTSAAEPQGTSGLPTTAGDATSGDTTSVGGAGMDLPNPEPAGLPAWGDGLAVGAWIEIPGTALASAPISVETGGNTGPRSKVIAWNGFALDPRDSSVYCAAAGGHADYAGNEVDRIRMSDDEPSWTEVSAATPWEQVIDSVTHYADGHPTSRHTYYGVVFARARDRIILLGGSRWGNGYPVSAMDGYDIVAQAWDPPATFPDPLGDFADYPGNGLLVDPDTDDIYAFGNYGVMRWSSASNTWAEPQSGTTVYGQYAATAFDTTRARILVASGLNSEHAIYDVASDAIESVDFIGPAAGELTPDSGNGMVYVPAMDAYLLRKADPGGAVLRIDAENFTVERFGDTSGDAIPPAINGVWRRFLYAPQLGGVLYFPDYAGNAWFLRTE